MEFGNGFCDCGDPSAFSKEGFCSEHSGFTSLEEHLDEDLSMELKLVMGRLLASLIYFAYVKKYENSQREVRLDVVSLLDKFFTNCYNLSAKNKNFLYSLLMCINDQDLVADLLPPEVVEQIREKKNYFFQNNSFCFNLNVDQLFLKDIEGRIEKVTQRVSFE